MRVTIFIGSPSQDEETQQLAGLLASRLQDAMVTTEIVSLNEYHIEPCEECGSCSQSNSLKCILSDGMRLLYQKMEAADVLVFGSPVYWFGVSGKTKMMVDRFKPYFVNKKLHGKKAALLLPLGSPEDDSHTTIEQFKRVFKALGMEFLDAITISTHDQKGLVQNAKVHDFIQDLKVKILENQHDIM